MCPSKQHGRKKMGGGSKRRLAARPRLHLHFRPTSAPWLNPMERLPAPPRQTGCFGLITAQAVRRGSVDGVAPPWSKPPSPGCVTGARARPFHWTKSAADIQRSLNNAALIYETRE